MQEVCGVDGQTYSSICALKHARMLLDYEGPCKTVGKYGSKFSSYSVVCKLFSALWGYHLVL